jgi:hypothetical protein
VTNYFLPKLIFERFYTIMRFKDCVIVIDAQRPAFSEKMPKAKPNFRRPKAEGQAKFQKAERRRPKAKQSFRRPKAKQSFRRPKAEGRRPSKVSEGRRPKAKPNFKRPKAEGQRPSKGQASPDL